MAHALAIACGVVLAALLTGCYLTRRTDSAVARAMRRALLFVAPLFLAALLFSLHVQWLLATVDIVKSSATIGQIEAAMDRVQLPSFLHAALLRTNPALPLSGLFLLAILPFVKAGTPYLGRGKRAAGALGAVYVAFAFLLTSLLLGHGSAQSIDAEMARMQAYLDDVVRKAATYKSEVEDAAREIVREELIEALDVSGIQEQLDALRLSLQAVQDEIEPYREILRATGRRFEGDTPASDFGNSWRSIQRTVNDLHWNRRAAAVSVPDVGRSSWSTLQLYEASSGLRNYQLARPKEEPSALNVTVAKTFDIMYAGGGRRDLGAELDLAHGHPLGPLFGSLGDVWYEPLKVLSAAQAEAVFNATLVQGQSFAEAADAARAQARASIEGLKPELQPGLDEVARGLNRLRSEVSRLPKSYRRFAERIYPDRLQAFLGTWHRLLSFSTPEAARAAAALRQRVETVLDIPDDPYAKHQRVTSYEHTLQTVARQVDETARYQALLLLEQQVLDGRPAAHDFARFTKRQVESRLSERREAGNGGIVHGATLAELEAQSQLLETHRLAESGLLNDPESQQDPGARERIMRHLAIDLEFMSRAILGKYRPETYTAENFRNRLRRYVKLAQALEPAFAEGGEFVNTASGNLTGRSAKGAMRFEIVHIIAKAEARLRLAPSPAALKLADLLREERDLLAVYQNGSDNRYVQALFELWHEADLRAEMGARVSETVVASIADDSERMKVPAMGAIRALRELVRRSKDKAREIDRLKREIAALETPDASLNKALAVAREQFLWLQERIRRDWAKTRRHLHISAAYRSR